MPIQKIVGEILENGLEAGLNDEMGYSRYHYRNKDSGNNRGGHSVKAMKNSFGKMDIEALRERKGEYKTQLVK